MENKLVSICIPAYNNADYIGQTIRSIIEQTYKNIELIIVDDNSTDNTLSVISEYANADDRIKIYHNDKNLGMSGNWNKCLSLCQGEYIKLICADDLLLPETIATEVKVLDDNPDVVLVCSDTKLVDMEGKSKGFYKRYPKEGPIDGKIISRKGFFLKNYYGAPQANTFRRSAYLQVGGFDANYTYILDYDFWVSISKCGKVVSIHKPLNQFRVRGDSNTGKVMGDDKEKTKAYVAEHRYLLEKNKTDLHLSAFDIRISVLIRRVRCFMGSVYLKLFVR